MITLPAALDVRLRRDADMTFFEYLVLSVLSEREERTMQMSEIAAGVSASLSRLSHVVTRLEKRGLICRGRLPGSGRRTSATLTDTGYAMVVAAAPGHVAAVREYLLDTLERADLATLRRIGIAVAGRVDPRARSFTVTSSERVPRSCPRRTPPSLRKASTPSPVPAWRAGRTSIAQRG